MYNIIAYCNVAVYFIPSDPPRRNRGLSWAIRFRGSQQENLPRKYLILIVFAVDIKTIYSEFIRVNLRARRCQNACASPGGLAVAGGLQSVANRARKHRTKFRSL